MRTGVKGDGMCAGGTATANSDPRDGVQNGQQQHHVKECVRGHGSGDVVGLSMPPAKLRQARQALITLALVASERPLYQVLALDGDARRPAAALSPLSGNDEPVDI